MTTIKKVTWFLGLSSLSLMLSAQQLNGPHDEDLPIAPLHAEDIPSPPPPPSPPAVPSEPMVPPTRPARSHKAARSLPPAMPSPVSVGDIAKVVPSKCVKPKGKFPWNLEKAKLSDLVDQVSRLTCRNFIIASGVKPSQEISIISRTPITVDQAWQAFQSTLEANELSLFKTGDYYKIIKRADSPRQPIAVVDEKGVLPNDEGMVTYLYDLKHLTKEVAQSLVKGLISRVGDVIVVGETFLVITDGSSNIRRVMSILGKVDVSGAANRIHIIDLVHADAVQIQQKLNDIFGGDKSSPNAPRGRSPYDDYGAAARPGPEKGTGSFALQKMIADERTNKLIIISSDRAFDRIKDMIDVLDVPSSGASTKGEIYVYHLKNGDSKKIATTMTSLLQGIKSGRSNNQPGQFGREETFEGEIKVSADEATNSLVIVASPRDYKTIVKVIAKLDKRRTQVYVEAAIMEVTLTDENTFDVGAFTGLPLFDGLGILATPSGQSAAKSMFQSIATAQGTNPQTTVAAGLQPFLSTLGFVGAGREVSLNGQKLTVPGVGAVINIVQKFSNVDILSTPSLMTLNNEPAEISVGRKIPTVSGVSAVGAVGGIGGLPIQQITQQEPKLKFKITPHVNDDNLIRMEIEQDIMDLGEYIPVVQGQPDQPSFTTKASKSTVSAQDQQTIVLGGLISDTYATSETKVPLLGDIPWIGNLFKKTVKTKKKTNLLLVLTPYAVRDDNDLRKIYERKNKEREEFSKMYFGDKITKFNPYVDYNKKKGPLASMIDTVRHEMSKTENGGPGLPGETVIKPAVHDDLENHKIQTLEPNMPPLEGAENLEKGPLQMEPTEIVTFDQPPMSVNVP